MIRTFLRAAAFATAKVVPASGGGACGAPSAEIRDQLAPTGKLRVGVYQGSPLSMVRNSSSGEMRGVTHDSGRELARCLGVPFETVVFPRLADVVQAVREGAVDVTLTNATAERAKVADFTPPLVLVEQGYLVRIDGLANFRYRTCRRSCRRTRGQHLEGTAGGSTQDRRSHCCACAEECIGNACATDDRCIRDQQGHPVRVV